MAARRWVVAGLVATAIALLVARAVARVYVDYAWFAALDATAVWRAQTMALLVMRLAAGAAAFLFVFANLYAVRHSVASVVFPRRVANLEIGEEVPGRYLMFAVVLIAFVMAMMLALMLDDWSAALLAVGGVPFGESDPYFSADLGFFVYWLPFEQQLYYWTLISAMIVAALVLFFYSLTPSLRWDRGRLYVSGYVRRHLTVLAGVILLVLAWSFRLDMYELLIAGGGPDGAFGYIDHKVLIPANLIVALATLGGALIVMFAGWTGQGRLASAAILGVLGLALLARQIAPALVRRSGTPEARDAREMPYATTREAYSLRGFDAASVRGEASAPFATLAEAVPNVALWDAPAIARALEASRRTEVGSGAPSWRGSSRGLVADVPERAPRSADSSRAFFVVSRVLPAAADGRGTLVRAGSAVGTEDSQLPPAVVFPGARGNLIAADTAAALAGASMAGEGARLAHALAHQRPRWAFDAVPRTRPVLVSHRDVRERIHTLAPFLVQGTSIVPIVLGDSLFWSVDLYVASSSYPLSQHLLLAGDARTYFQHAATAFVRAATGETRLVADSVAGPLAQTWRTRFPTLFAPWSSLPATMRAALPPPLDAMRAQGLSFAHFAMRPEGPFNLPPLDGADSAFVDVEPMMADPATGAPFTTQVVLDGRDRVRGTLIARGGVRRGVSWLPVAEIGPKWTAVIDRLDDADSSSLAGAPHDDIRARGPVRVVPIGATLVYLQPTYDWSAQGAPTLRHVAVWLGDTVRVAPTLAELVGLAAIAPPARPDIPTRDARARAAELYDLMRAALQRGDWAAFGRAFDALGSVLGASSANPRR